MTDSHFPHRAMLTLQEYLRSLGVEVVFDEVRGRKETYWKTSAVPIGSHGIELFVYNDEAGVMVDGRQWFICEHADVDQDDELIAALIERLRRLSGDDDRQP